MVFKRREEKRMSIGNIGIRGIASIIVIAVFAIAVALIIVKTDWR